VKEFPDRGGRLPYRLWYEESEIEGIIARELELAGHPRLAGSPATDVEAFLELHLGLLVEYAWLPRGVLGASEFTAKGEARVQVSAELSRRAERDPGAATLLRSTVAHEAAHALLHRVLFLRESTALFGPGVTTRTELCRSVGFTRPGYQGEWWEWQANRGMAALLLPAGALTAWMADRERAQPGEKVTERRLAAAQAFAVSADAVRRRLAQLEGAA
jgi:IrrE N-terminal-like domain